MIILLRNLIQEANLLYSTQLRNPFFITKDARNLSKEEALLLSQVFKPYFNTYMTHMDHYQRRQKYKYYEIRTQKTYTIGDLFPGLWHERKGYITMIYLLEALEQISHAPNVENFLTDPISPSQANLKMFIIEGRYYDHEKLGRFEHLLIKDSTKAPFFIAALHAFKEAYTKIAFSRFIITGENLIKMKSDILNLFNKKHLINKKVDNELQVLTGGKIGSNYCVKTSTEDFPLPPKISIIDYP